MHSMQDRKKAKKLAAILEERNLLVITSAKIQPFLRENRTKMMKVINEKVDFVIPLVTECLMKQIQPTVYSTQEEIALESEANYFMYDLLLNEYSSQGCINRRVKPVCDSSESRKLAFKDPILSWSFHLQNEAMKLLKELISSKKRLECLK
ncbi:uncharacterized protein CEXT_795961 [Caerostris extrusa]|uniref:Uncharacterized protein n=1 Tax=Caerostris extrusa TaxID=172846 RepID=A0AAV4RYG7_CAEEX|nr:uncharacterized protein CEXT_795961 [Caerostris extrusa]